MNKILCGIAVCASALAVSSCKTETVYILPEEGVTRLTVSPVSVTMGYADEMVFTVGIRPGNAVCTWESSDPSIAYVDENNRIVPLKVGEVEIKASAGFLEQTIPVTIHSSVIIENKSFYLDEGDTSNLPFVRVLPEDMPFTVTSSNTDAVSIPNASALGIRTEGSGLSTITIETEDGQKGSFQVGVAAKDNVINAAKADGYFYEGASLGHAGYGIVALALQPSGVTYADGGEWSGDGKALFLKLYQDSSLGELPNGEYTAGTGAYNFFASGSASYVIDGDAKTAITAGTLNITDSGITGYVSSSNDVYKISFSGKRTQKNHYYDMDEYRVDVNDEWCDGTCQVCLDPNGTKIFGGATNGWQYKLANSASNTYLMLLLYASNNEDPTGSYPLSMGWCDRNRLMVNSGYAYYSSLRINGTRYTFNANTASDVINISDYEDNSTTLTTTITGQITTNYTQSVSEIAETRTIPLIITVNVDKKVFNVSSSRMTN